MPPERRLVIALDGPSGSGKSTVARRVASALGLRFLDTGAMYRALTWWALERGVDLDDQAEIAKLARELPLTISTDPERSLVQVGDTDITSAIRETRISERVSAVATNLEVRTELVRRQRAIVDEGAVVAEGRDITTVVAPDAAVRVLLTADEHTRVARRSREVHGRADAGSLAATRAQVLYRDARDASVAEFHQPNPGVDVIDSSAMALDDVVKAVLELVARKTSINTAKIDTVKPENR